MDKCIYQRYLECRYFIVTIFVFCIGLVFKYFGQKTHYWPYDLLGDVFILSMSVSILTGMYLKRKDDFILRNVLGISQSSSFLDVIWGILKPEDYFVDYRKSEWKVITTGPMLSIQHTENFEIVVHKEKTNFYFRRGYDREKIKIKEILIAKEGEKLKPIEYGNEFNEHLLVQRHGGYDCYELTNLNLEPNTKYALKIVTIFEKCMDAKRDYISVDAIVPIRKTDIFLEFPFSLKSNNKPLYHIDVKRRSLTKFIQYIDWGYKDNSGLKNNVIEVNYESPLTPGDSIVIYYKKSSGKSASSKSR